MANHREGTASSHQFADSLFSSLMIFASIMQAKNMARGVMMVVVIITVFIGTPGLEEVGEYIVFVCSAVTATY